jgi:hypothetical protein
MRVSSQSEQPSLAEMAVGALDALDADDEPFFLLVRPFSILSYPLSAQRDIANLTYRWKLAESIMPDAQMKLLGSSTTF